MINELLWHGYFSGYINCFTQIKRERRETVNQITLTRQVAPIFGTPYKNAINIMQKKPREKKDP